MGALMGFLPHPLLPLAPQALRSVGPGWAGRTPVL